jgi:hypothetical protein
MAQNETVNNILFGKYEGKKHLEDFEGNVTLMWISKT